ncbi:MAG: tRNA epoxyqueuosine(34) reductase QueG [Fuerstiella sp.]|nr:tRNA epoxyqueuosine(34) reductase QueG [Fuerstiella sp.]
MNTRLHQKDEVTETLKQNAAELGFQHLGIAPAISPPGYHPLLEWIASGHAADMNWIARRKDAYRHPDGVLPNTRSVIVAAMNYHNHSPQPQSARISRYAWGSEDYHTLLRRRLKKLAVLLRTTWPTERTRVVVDTAPLMERDFARLAGVGWVGKNTMLISRNIGSWFFLGAILTTAELVYDQPFDSDYCGTCTKCLQACPTDAFPEPHVLDSNRCISYLTIERRDKSIDENLRTGIGDWLFGCDICQEVCPWNRFAPNNSDTAFEPREDLIAPDLVQLLSMDNDIFKQQFSGTPLERTGRDVIVRNAAIVAGNQRCANAIPQLTRLLDDGSDLVREAAGWAIEQISTNSVQ